MAAALAHQRAVSVEATAEAISRLDASSRDVSSVDASS
jgi:hypothetical protein